MQVLCAASHEPERHLQRTEAAAATSCSGVAAIHRRQRPPKRPMLQRLAGRA
jgi:hypothetical protein